MTNALRRTLFAICVAGLAGCAAGPKNAGMMNAADPTDSTTARRQELRLRNDPLGYIAEIRDRCSKIDQYTITFIRQERRGIGFLKSMQPPERISCWFRREPFSIRMKWNDPEIKYGESTFVEGEQGNQVRFMPRHGLFGLPPGITRVNVQTPVTWGEARYTVRDFGMENMLNRSLATVDEALGKVVTRYLGHTKLGADQRTAAGLRLEYSPSLFPAPIQEIYFDVETELPVGTITRFPDETIDTAYFYENLDTTVALCDADFVLDLERKKAAVSAAAASEQPRGD